MEIADTAKFAIGIVFLLLAIGLALRSRGARGFGQKRQAALLFLLAGIVFLALGLGYIAA